MGFLQELVGLKQLNFAPQSNLDPQERWLVTLAAVLSSYNGDYVNTVETGRDNDELAPTLKEMYGIYDRRSFEECAAWLRNGGHRNEYIPPFNLAKDYINFVNGLPAIVRTVIKEVYPDLLVTLFQLKNRTKLQEYVKAHKQKFHEIIPSCNLLLSLDRDSGKQFNLHVTNLNSLVAWDAVRLVNITRWSIEAGYIDRNEFLHFAGQLTAEVKSAYSSWQEVVLAYLCASSIWNSDAERTDAFYRATNNLAYHQDSPFKTVAFK